MSLLSQLSEGGFSDIIPDVDNFMEENNIQNEVKHILLVSSNNNASVLIKEEDEDKIKPVQFPPNQPRNLCTDDYTGPFDFNVFIIPSEQKTPWEFSAKLNKIFIGINLQFPVAFSVQRRPEDVPLFVRTTPFFSQTQFFQESVRRCVAHQHPQDASNSDVHSHVVPHILRCSNPQTQYFGDEHTRLNLVVPLAMPQAGTDVVKEFYHFVCKNSCPSGMARRPIDIVFTLETYSGEVLGRRRVSVRVCSCPKRDREKEENDLDKRNPVKRGKKRRLVEEVDKEEIVDTKIMPLQLNIVGERNRQLILTYCRDLMASEIVRLEGNSGADKPFRKCFNDIDALINKPRE